MRRILFLTFLILITASLASTLTIAADTSRHVPTIDELLTLKTISGAQISPDGEWVAYTVTNADFKQDAFVTQIWLAETGGKGRTLQLTRGEKSSTNPRWSPDGQRLAFLSHRIEEKNQIFLIDLTGGVTKQITKSETAINNFAWSEDGKTIAYSATEPTAQPLKDRKEYYGDYDVVHAGYNYVHIWSLDVAEAMKSPIAGKQRTKKTD